MNKIPNSYVQCLAIVIMLTTCITYRMHVKERRSLLTVPIAIGLTVANSLFKIQI